MYTVKLSGSDEQISCWSRCSFSCYIMQTAAMYIYTSGGFSSTAIMPGYQKGWQQDAAEFLNSLMCIVGKHRYIPCSCIATCG